MVENKVNELFMYYKDNVPKDKALMFKSALKDADDSKYDNVMAVKIHNSTTIILMSVFLGGLGIDRFLIGDTGLGVAKLLLGWATFGVWPLIDIFFCYKKAKEINLQNLLLALK